MKTTMNTKLIGKIKSVEDLLAAQMGDEKLGNIDDLPIGHPMRMAMERAKEKFEQQQAKQQTIKQPQKPLSAKDKHLQHKQQVQAHEQSVDDKYTHAQAINADIDLAMNSTRKLLETISQHKDELFDMPQCRINITRLERMLAAFYRGLDQSKITRSRLNNVMQYLER